MVEVRVLGPLEVSRDGTPVPIPSRRQRALLTRLVLLPGQTVTVDALVDAAWEERPPRGSRHALHTQVSRLRALLGPDAVVTRPGGYALVVPAESVDAQVFEAGVAQVGQVLGSDPAAALQRLAELLDRWRGRAYEEFADSFANAASVRLDEVRRTARERLAEASLATGDEAAAIVELESLIQAYPLRERPHELLLRALYQAGRQSEALAVYQRLRERLRDELGIDPSPALRQVHEQALRQQLPQAAPPPAVVAATAVAPQGTASLPARPPTSFVGRDRELRELTELIQTERLVTLVGPGGVGKTRLAQELAAEAGVVTVGWVDLSPVRAAMDLLYRIVDALGLPQPAHRSIEEFIVEELRRTPGLLVVDNCEQVIEPAARLIETIVTGCPDLVVLATSREPLAVAGERVFPLGPLTALDLAGSAAVSLFTDRLRAAGAPPPTEAQLPVVAEICHRVGNLPLAIELAAARARSLGLATVAHRPALDLLSGGNRSAPDRHRSLRAVLDWSHDLLSGGEQILFRRLAVFAGWFRLEDVERICVDPLLPEIRIPEALAGLVERSMVAGPVEERYRLPYPTREYAAERLAGHGEDRWLGAAHARHLVALAERAQAHLHTAAELTWLGRLAGRIDELRAAHHWTREHDPDLAVRLVVAVARYAHYHMRFELQDWANTAAELPGAAGHPLRAAALGSAASGAWARGEFDRARQLATEGVAAAAAGDPVAALPTLVLGDVAMLAGRFTDAAAHYQQVIDLSRDTDPYLLVEALGGHAMLLSLLGDQPAALARSEEAERLAQRWGSPSLRSAACYFAAECRLRHEPARALELLAESRRLAASTGAVLMVGLAILATVSVRARADAEPAEALAAYQEAIEHWHRSGNRTQQWMTLRNLIPTLVRNGHYRLALVVKGALDASPVRLPAEVPVPEAAALAEAIDRAAMDVGEQAAEADTAEGARLPQDALVELVLSTIDQATEPVLPDR